MCKRKICNIKLKVIYVAVILIFSTSSVCTQTLALSDCINLFERDTSFFRTFYIKNYDKKDTIYFDTDSYSIDRKSLTIPFGQLKKTVSTNSSGNALIFSFIDIEQFNIFEREFKLRNYTLTFSGDDGKIGKFKFYTDPKGKLEFALTEHQLEQKPFKALYTLLISGHN